MLLSVQLVILQHSEVEVTQRQSQSGQEVGEEGTYFSVLFAFVGCNHIEDGRKHDDEDKEENEEHLQVDDHVDDHGHDVAETHDDAHEEERLQERDQQQNDEGDLGGQMQGAYEHLAVHVEHSQHNVEDVDVVPPVHEVHLALLDHLGAIIEGRVNQTH